MKVFGIHSRRVGFAQHRSVIVNRNRHCKAVIRIARRVMMVVGRTPLSASLARGTDHWFAAGDQREWAILTTFAFAPNPHSSRGNALAGGISIGPPPHEDLAYRDSNERRPASRRRFSSSMSVNSLIGFARHGFLITTAQFSESARAFVRGKPITLISGRDLIGWIDSRYSARRTAENSERDIRTPARPPLFDPFSVLGLHQGATRDQIRAAYRREMANYHPDKVAHLGQDLQELAKRRAQDINRAYEELLREG